MNAGTRQGEIGTHVNKVWVIDKSGSEKIIQITPQSFSYRHNHILKPGDIIYQVSIYHDGVVEKAGERIREYLQIRNKTQPLSEKNCGCVFQNSQNLPAGMAIDLLGLKGFKNGDLEVSKVHGNFVINKLSGSSPDFIRLIEALKSELLLQYGIKFDLEVKI